MNSLDPKELTELSTLFDRLGRVHYTVQRDRTSSGLYITTAFETARRFALLFSAGSVSAGRSPRWGVNGRDSSKVATLLIASRALRPERETQLRLFLEGRDLLSIRDPSVLPRQREIDAEIKRLGTLLTPSRVRATKYSAFVEPPLLDIPEFEDSSALREIEEEIRALSSLDDVSKGEKPAKKSAFSFLSLLSED